MSESPAAVQIDAYENPITEGYVGVEMRRELTGTTYLMFLDLSNGNGAYRHTEVGHIVLGRFSGEMLKANASAQWNALFGVILAIDGTNATIAWFEGGSLRAYGTDSFYDRRGGLLFPIVVPLEIESGDLKHVVTDFKEVDAAVNTAMTMKDVADNDVTPAVGDIIIRAQRVSGTGNAEIHYSAMYYTVA